MRRVLFLGLLTALCGCSNISDLLSFDNKPSEDETVVTQAAVAPAAPALPDDSFCRDIAQRDATSSDFDEATKKRIALQSYAQCHAIYGH